MEKNQVIFNVEEPERDLEEAVKVLRSNLIYSGEDTHVVVVTSVQPAEGKSTVSFLLAKSFADLKKRRYILTQTCGNRRWLPVMASM